MLTVAGAWNGLGLAYGQDLGNDPENIFGAFYMKKFGSSFVKVEIAEPESSEVSFTDLLMTGIQYDYNFTKDYRVGVEYLHKTAKDVPDASTWYITLSKGLDFDGFDDAIRHYL